MIRMIVMFGLLVGPVLLPANRTSGGERDRHYTVRSGDSLYTIARKFGVTIRSLREANGIDADALLHPGERLSIPEPQKRRLRKSPSGEAEKKAKRQEEKTQAKNRYTVRQGDTLSTIAEARGVSLKALLKANGMKADTLIRVGQVLLLPPPSETRRQDASAGKSGTASAARRTASDGKKGRAGVHVVRYGDTLFSIARKYHTPLKDLMALNGIAPTDVIHPGQELKIPGSSYRAKKSASSKGAKTRKRPPEKSRDVFYVVKHGDTLWEIAKKHKTSVTEIRRLNKMKRKDVIRSGMKLVIKKGTTTTVSSGRPTRKDGAKKRGKTIAKTYTVKKGDTLWEIAKKHKTSVAELRKLNDMKRSDVIRTGMKLTVGYEKVPPTRVASKKKKKSDKKRISRKKDTKKRRTASLSKTKKSKRTAKARRSADRRINSALAALSGKGSGRSTGGRGDYNVIRTAKRYLGRRYVWGAEGPSSFDCSGFTQYVMRKSKGVKLPRVSRKQAYYGKYVTRSQLRPGDLVFFDTSRRRRGYVNHVGIYIGNGKFIHASSARHRVVITSLNSPFYRARFKWGRRVN